MLCRKKARTIDSLDARYVVWVKCEVGFIAPVKRGHKRRVHVGVSQAKRVSELMSRHLEQVDGT